MMFFSSGGQEYGMCETDNVGECGACAHGSINDAFEEARVRIMLGPYGGVA